MGSNEHKNVEKGSKPNIVLGFDKLFEPTLELLGIEIREFIKGKLDNWKEKKRSENIQGHVQRALNSPDAEKITERRKKNETQLVDAIKLEEWMKGAENIDPNEPVLGAIWQEMLKKLLQGDGPEEYLLKKMKNLSPNEAILLLLLKEKGPSGLRDPSVFHSLFHMSELERNIFGKLNKDRLYLDMLKDKGLVEKKYLKHVMNSAAATIILAIVLEIPFNIFKINIDPNPIILGTEIPIFMFIYPLVFMLFFIVFGVGRYSLTEIGREIVRYAPVINIDELLEIVRKEANL